MKDLSAYYEIARLITAELSETITPEEKERLMYGWRRMNATI